MTNGLALYNFQSLDLSFACCRALLNCAEVFLIQLIVLKMYNYTSECDLFPVKRLGPETNSNSLESDSGKYAAIDCQYVSPESGVFQETYGK